MPRPSRVIKNCSRQRNHVRISGLNDPFRLLESRDETNRHHRYSNRSFDGPGEGHLVARTHRNLLIKTVAAARHVDRITA
jgi:hypothetical protein